jgi:hypothetical protein
MTSEHLASAGWRLLPWLGNIVIAFLVWWAAQVNGQLANIQLDVQALREWRAETAANRFTSHDHARFAQTQAQEQLRLWQAVAELQREIMGAVGEIKTSVSNIETRLQFERREGAK